jgi:hypothetical protein
VVRYFVPFFCVGLLARRITELSAAFFVADIDPLASLVVLSDKAIGDRHSDSTDIPTRWLFLDLGALT